MNTEYWQAFIHSDADYDGLFWMGVKTTGIFCRPSCKARKPLKQNCLMFASLDEAQQSGLRACKRCKPELLANEHPSWVNHILTALSRSPEWRLKDQEVRALNVCPVRLRRYFQNKYACTFQQWQRQQRLSETRADLQAGKKLKEAVRGYESESGYRAAVQTVLKKKSERSQEVLYLKTLPSPLGDLWAGVVNDQLVLLEFVVKARHLRQLKIAQKLFSATVLEKTHPLHQQLQKELNAYFQGTCARFTVPMNAPGTEFQREVWQQLRQIRPGETISYQELAARVGVPGANRAVGTANGVNRIAILIPCHRVINKSGNLGGYGGGLARKSALLKLEKIFISANAQ